MEAAPNLLSDFPEIEYLDGRPFPKLSPKRTHGRLQYRLARIIDDCAGERGEVIVEWRCRVGAVDGTHTEFVPDLAYASYQRLDTISEDAAEEPPFAPEICVEVRSPGDKIWYLQEKLQRYLKTGAHLVLDVDPAIELITAYSEGRPREYERGDVFEHEAAPWLTFDVGRLFDKPGLKSK